MDYSSLENRENPQTNEGDIQQLFSDILAYSEEKKWDSKKKINVTKYICMYDLDEGMQLAEKFKFSSKQIINLLDDKKITVRYQDTIKHINSKLSRLWLKNNNVAKILEKIESNQKSTDNEDEHIGWGDSQRLRWEIDAHYLQRIKNTKIADQEIAKFSKLYWDKVEKYFYSVLNVWALDEDALDTVMEIVAKYPSHSQHVKRDNITLSSIDILEWILEEKDFKVIKKLLYSPLKIILDLKKSEAIKFVKKEIESQLLTHSWWEKKLQYNNDLEKYEVNSSEDALISLPVKNLLPESGISWFNMVNYSPAIKLSKKNRKWKDKNYLLYNDTLSQPYDSINLDTTKQWNTIVSKSNWRTKNSLNILENLNINKTISYDWYTLFEWVIGDNSYIIIADKVKGSKNRQASIYNVETFEKVHTFAFSWRKSTFVNIEKWRLIIRDTQREIMFDGDHVEEKDIMLMSGEMKEIINKMLPKKSKRSLDYVNKLWWKKYYAVGYEVAGWRHKYYIIIDDKGNIIEDKIEDIEWAIEAKRIFDFRSDFGIDMETAYHEKLFYVIDKWLFYYIIDESGKSVWWAFDSIKRCKSFNWTIYFIGKRWNEQCIMNQKWKCIYSHTSHATDEILTNTTNILDDSFEIIETIDDIHFKVHNGTQRFYIDRTWKAITGWSITVDTKSENQDNYKLTAKITSNETGSYNYISNKDWVKIRKSHWNTWHQNEKWIYHIKDNKTSSNSHQDIVIKYTPAENMNIETVDLLDILNHLWKDINTLTIRELEEFKDKIKLLLKKIPRIRSKNQFAWKEHILRDLIRTNPEVFKKSLSSLWNRNELVKRLTYLIDARSIHWFHHSAGSLKDTLFSILKWGAFWIQWIRWIWRKETNENIEIGEIFASDNPINDFLITWLYAWYNEEIGLSVASSFPIHNKVNGPRKFFDCSIPAFALWDSTLLIKPINAKINSDQCKQELVWWDIKTIRSTQNQSWLSIVPTQRNTNKITYTISTSQLPPRMPNIKMTEYAKFAKEFTKLYWEEFLNDYSRTWEKTCFNIKTEDFLNTISALSPSERVYKIENFVKNNMFYEYQDTDIADAKDDLTRFEKIKFCEERAKKLWKNKKIRAWVCYDAVFITEAMLRRSWLISGHSSWYFSSQRKITKEMWHWVSYVVFPNWWWWNQVHMVDWTPPWSPNTMESLYERELSVQRKENAYIQKLKNLMKKWISKEKAEEYLQQLLNDLEYKKESWILQLKEKANKVTKNIKLYLTKLFSQKSSSKEEKLTTDTTPIEETNIETTTNNHNYSRNEPTETIKRYLQALLDQNLTASIFNDLLKMITYYQFTPLHKKQQISENSIRYYRDLESEDSHLAVDYKKSKGENFIFLINSLIEEMQTTLGLSREQAVERWEILLNNLDFKSQQKQEIFSLLITFLKENNIW